jgi:hypothetical protein
MTITPAVIVAAINAAEIGSYVDVDVPFPGDPAS